MKISESTMYGRKGEAEEVIRWFKEEHPKSKKRFVVRKADYYWIEEVA